MKRLIAGCGPGFEKREGDVTLDFKSAFNPDIFFNISKGLKWPFEDNEFDEIQAWHILEHIELFKNYKKAMEEMYRILKPGGIIHIKVPFWKHDSAVETADHVRFFGANSFHDWQTINPYKEEMEYKTNFEQVMETVNPDENGNPREVECIMKKV